MAYSYFLGNPKVIQAMLKTARTKVLLSETEKRIMERFGYIILRVFGYPLATPSRHVRKMMLNFIKSERIKNGKLLDIGCSIGHDSLELAKRRGYRVVGIDIDKVSIDTAQEIKDILRIKNASFLNMDILQSKFKDEEFDTIIMLEILEHLKNDFQAIREISRVLKKGGILILSTPYSSGGQKFSHAKRSLRLKEDMDERYFKKLFPGGFHWKNGYDENSIESLLKKTGLKITDVNFVCLPRIIPELEERTRIFFPLTYFLSLFTKFFSSNKLKIVVKAKKFSSGHWAG